MAELPLDHSMRTLYIIGNGFDLMHGVPSRYTEFRDYLGKHSELRKQLEDWNLKEDLWSDLEDSLAHMDDEGMMGTVPDMMDIMGVPEEDDDDFSAADFFSAAEWAVYPLQVIEAELPKRFRKWIERLRPAGTAKPLVSVINNNGYYINFNYTVFLESIYGVPSENVLYIHGDRRKKKQELILGHAPGAEEALEYHKKEWKPRFHNQTSYDMHMTAGRHVAEYYDITTKRSDMIIENNRERFEALSDIKVIVVIGHSLSYVDYPYFKEIKQKTGRAVWNLGWHNSSDLKRIRAFVNVIGIGKEQIVLFRK